jgi:large subunit ribosomal protein L20
MTRVKRGTAANKRRKNVLQQTKGFRWGRKSKFRQAKEALYHALEYSYRDRKTKKRIFRQAWQSSINSACRQMELPYNKFMSGLKKNKIEIDRKILSDLVKNKPEIFRQLVEKVKS